MKRLNNITRRTASAMFAALVLTFALSATAARAQTTAFTYQGKLTDSGTTSATYDLQFALDNGALLITCNGAAASNNVCEDIFVSNGVFTVRLDFGAAAFDGASRSLQIGVRRGAETGAFTALAPNQPITSVPYAIQSATATNAVNLGGAAATNYQQKTGDASQLTNLNATNIASGTLADAQLSSNVAFRNTANTFTSNQTVNGNLAQTGTTTDLNLTNGFVVRGTLNSGTIPATGVGIRMMFYGRKGAFRAGYVDGSTQMVGTPWDDENIGIVSTAFGYNAKASGTASIASGYRAVASGYGSTAFGEDTAAIGDSSTAFGDGTLASGANSTASGYSTKANGDSSTAFGRVATANGNSSTAFGYFSKAIGDYSTASGNTTTANGNSSTALGNTTTAGGNSSTAFGRSTKATGDYSTAFGDGTLASGVNSTTFGKNTTASNDSSTAFGNTATASGVISTAFGNTTAANGNSSTAFGRLTTAGGDYSTAFGDGTLASGVNSTTFGKSTRASSSNSTAFGNTTTASGNGSTAFGNNTTASGDYSTAFGDSTTASGNYSTAFGYNSRASGNSSTALGSNALTNNQAGSFVYGDASTANFISASAPNQFVVRASGGFIFGTNANISTGCSLPAGSGVFNCTSSRTMKENFLNLRGGEILEKLRRIPVMEWNYKGEKEGVRHIGAFAEDFYREFRLGTDDKSIGLLDIAGVNTAAIKELDDNVRSLRTAGDAQIKMLQAENDTLKSRLDQQQTQIETQQKQINQFKQIACAIKPDAEICRQ